MSEQKLTDKNDPSNPADSTEKGVTTIVTRSLFGGLLMGLANLVPGISGGTMLLAAGVYPAFIKALADVTRFKFRFRSILVLACVVGAAGLGILCLAGSLKELVVHHRWIMYSLFIGLTLGGVPLVWRMARPANTNLLVASLISFIMMCTLTVLQIYGFVGGGGSNVVMLLLAGLAGASAMILPGLSGSYLLILMGQYVPILSSVEEFREALSARDFSAAMGPALTVLLPVGIGVVLGVVLVGNLLEWLLRRYRKETLGVLLGLLIGSVVGLFPFQTGVQPEVGDIVKAQVVTEESLLEIDEEDWPTEFYRPTTYQALGSIALIGVGLATTFGIAMLGSDDSEAA